MNDAIAAIIVRNIDKEAKLKAVQPVKYAHVNSASHLDKQYPELKNAYRNTHYNGQNNNIPSRPRNPVELTRWRGVHHPVRMSGSDLHLAFASHRWLLTPSFRSDDNLSPSQIM